MSVCQYVSPSVRMYVTLLKCIFIRTFFLPLKIFQHFLPLKIFWNFNFEKNLILLFYCSIVIYLWKYFKIKFTSENFWIFFWNFFWIFFYKNYFITSENISTFITWPNFPGKLQNAITNWMEGVLGCETPRKWVKIPF